MGVCFAFISVIVSTGPGRGSVCRLRATGMLLVTEDALDVLTPGRTVDAAVFIRDSVIGDSTTTERARGR
ncbi:hypothetical protein Harman_35400 [Haloarcula mannanilytica]|uniref:Uncharacterized protein n=1 Tax=Haloarcula mannanilytica TaxID=2509225 RepID=A0A4C2EMN4_9EURY|nr:hypothetical protein Harman_35400 [Haloarcula mannanilytica]